MKLLDEFLHQRGANYQYANDTQLYHIAPGYSNHTVNILFSNVWKMYGLDGEELGSTMTRLAIVVMGLECPTYFKLKLGFPPSPRQSR